MNQKLYKHQYTPDYPAADEAIASLRERSPEATLTSAQRETLAGMIGLCHGDISWLDTVSGPATASREIPVGRQGTVLLRHVSGVGSTVWIEPDGRYTTP